MSTNAAPTTAELKARVDALEQAQHQTETEVVERLEAIAAHLKAANYGLAGDALAALLTDLTVNPYASQDSTLHSRALADAIAGHPALTAS